MTEQEKLEHELGTPAQAEDVSPNPASHTSWSDDSSSHLRYRESATVTMTSSHHAEPSSESSTMGLKAAPLRSAPPPERKNGGPVMWLALAGAAALGGAMVLAGNASTEPPQELAARETTALAPKQPSPPLPLAEEVAAAAAAPVQPVQPVDDAPVADEPPADEPAAKATAAKPPAAQRPSAARAAKAKPTPPATQAEAKQAEQVEASAPAKPTADPFATAPATPPAPTSEPAQPSAQPTPSAPEPEQPSAEKPSGDRKYSTECLLDPNAPGCRDEKVEKAPDHTIDGMAGSLPEKLSQADLRTGITPRKAVAKSCGDKHGVAPGTIVRVKLSIEGATGKVVSAEALSPHDQQPVGRCVAEALAGAVFPKFKTQRQGATYPVKL